MRCARPPLAPARTPPRNPLWSAALASLRGAQALAAAVLLSVAFAPSAARAQEAPAPAAAPAQVWARGALSGTRFPDSAAVTLSAADGDALSVVAAWDGRYRVRRGLDFGWVSALSVSLVEPPPAEGAAVPLQLGGPAPSLR